MNLTSASIQWLETGEPYSQLFDDIYFSRQNGLQESQYVFIQQNRLPQRWLKQKHFSIGELGFGSGLNFLASIDCWLKNSSQGATLSYTSFEQFPFSYTDYQQMERLLQKRWPHLLSIFQSLKELYPIQQNVKQLLLYNGQVKLQIFYQDALATMLETQRNFPIPQVDAWYLDGFDPSKNNQLWNQEIYYQLVKYSSPTASFSTYTAAGHVRRGLMEAGFAVRKEKGFAHKREMLCGVLKPSIGK